MVRIIHDFIILKGRELSLLYNNKTKVLMELENVWKVQTREWNGEWWITGDSSLEDIYKMTGAAYVCG